MPKKKPGRPPASLPIAVAEIMEAKGLDEGTATAIITDIASTRDGLSRKMQERWGKTFSELLAIRQMAQVAIHDVRAGLVSKSAAIADVALNATHERLTDPAELALVGTKDLAGIGKMMTDNALNLQNGSAQGGIGTLNIIADLRALRDRQAEVRPSLMDRLKAAGKIQEGPEGEAA